MASRRNSLQTPTDEAPRRCGLYARVSTPEQNVDVQLVELRAHAQNRGWVIGGEYTDIGTGSNAKRPGLDALLGDAGAKFDIVVAIKLDRIGRSIQDVLQIITDLTDRDVDVVCVKDAAIDSTSASGRLMLGICACFGEYERSVLIERTRAGMAFAKARGQHIGRPRRALDLRAARVLLEQGISVRQVASMLSVPRATLQRRLVEAGMEVAHKSPSGDPPVTA